MPNTRFEALARAGYGARGVVYLVLGAFAVTSAVWGTDEAEGTSSALSSLLGLPFGRILLGSVAVGLSGYVLWKLAQGIFDADGVGDDIKGVVSRAGQLVSAGANLFLMLTAAELAFTGGGGSDVEGEERASAWLLQQPFGAFLLGLAGAIVIVAGLIQIWYGVSDGYEKRLSLPPRQASWMTQVCKVGLVARGVLLSIVGGFLCFAATTESPEQAGGTAEALEYVHSLAFGTSLYGMAAVGLAAFGAYGLIQARYRSINAPSLALDGKEPLSP